MLFRYEYEDINSLKIVLGIAEIPYVCTFSSDLQIKHHLIFFILKRVCLLKMEAADGFAFIPYPEVGKFTLSYSTFQVIVFKLPSTSGVYWG